MHQKTLCSLYTSQITRQKMLCSLYTSQITHRNVLFSTYTTLLPHSKLCICHCPSPNLKRPIRTCDPTDSVPFSSVPWPIGSSGGHGGEFSGDPLPVCFVADFFSVWLAFDGCTSCFSHLTFPWMVVTGCRNHNTSKHSLDNTRVRLLRCHLLLWRVWKWRVHRPDVQGLGSRQLPEVLWYLWWVYY